MDTSEHVPDIVIHSSNGIISIAWREQSRLKSLASLVSDLLWL